MKAYMKKEEEGVSPVIATILMVAITVVLAATLYLMVGNIGGGGNTPVAGSLTYDTQHSDSTNGYTNFTLSLSQPSNPKIGDVHVKVYDASGTLIASYTGTTAASTPATHATVNWVHIVSDTGYVNGGDHLYIDAHSLTSPDLHGATVYVSISGYQGTISGTVPS